MPEWVVANYPGLIENFGMSIFSKIVDNEIVGNRLYKMRWWLWDFSLSKFDLLLGDHPLLFTSAIEDPRLIVALPISPTKAFMATQNEDVAKALRTQDVDTLVRRLNESSVNQSEKRIYALNKKHWRFIQNRKF